MWDAPRSTARGWGIDFESGTWDRATLNQRDCSSMVAYLVGVPPGNVSPQGVSLVILLSAGQQPCLCCCANRRVAPALSQQERLLLPAGLLECFSLEVSAEISRVAHCLCSHPGRGSPPQILRRTLPIYLPRENKTATFRFGRVSSFPNTPNG